ncbi:unnamed protein product [Diamesa tonsa]
MENPDSSFLNSGNTIINNEKDLNNHIYNFTNIINGQKKEIGNDSTLVKYPEDVMKEEILEFVWKYLSLEDKFNCTLVCKRLNNFVSSMNFFRPNIRTFWKSNCKKPKPLQTFTRNYKTLDFKSFDLCFLSPRYLKMLKYFSCSVIELKFNHSKVKKFCKVLAEFPLVESLELKDVTIISSKLALEKLPKFLHLRNLKIDGYSNHKMYGVFILFGCAEKIQSLSLKYANEMGVNELNHFLNQLNNSLEFLSFKSCKLIPDPLDSIFDCFDSLHQLRKLRLLHSDEVTKRVLTSKSIYELTDFEVKYNVRHKDQVTSFLRNYFKLKEINDLQLTEYQATKEPIITNIKSSNSENSITTFYHFHHCTSKSLNCYDHNKCKIIPLMDSELDWIQNKNFKAFLLIQVRDNVKDFNHLFRNQRIYQE